MNSGYRPNENQIPRPTPATPSTRARPAKTHRFTPVAAPASLTAPDGVRPAPAGQTHSSDTRDIIVRRGLQPTVIVRRLRGLASEVPTPLGATDVRMPGAAEPNAPISPTPAPSSARASNPHPGIGAATALSRARAARAIALEAEGRRKEEAAASAAEVPSEGARPAAIDVTSARSTATPSAKAASVQGSAATQANRAARGASPATTSIPANPTPAAPLVGAATALKQAREAARAKAEAEAAARATAKAAASAATPSAADTSTAEMSGASEAAATRSLR